MPSATFRIDLVLKADYAEAYIAQLAVEHCGPDAIIDVVYGPPDEHGLVCVIGEAHAR